jgi:hypothetical protein
LVLLTICCLCNSCFFFVGGIENTILLKDLRGDGEACLV